MPAVDFDDPFAEGEAPDERPRRAGPGSIDAADALLRLLIGDGRDCRAIGRRALVVAWVTGALPEIRTQVQLASRLGVTPARACQMIADLRRVHRENRRAA